MPLPPLLLRNDDCARKLVGAGRRLIAAGVAGEQRNNAPPLHALHQRCNRFQVSVATGGEGEVVAALPSVRSNSILLAQTPLGENECLMCWSFPLLFVVCWSNVPARSRSLRSRARSLPARSADRLALGQVPSMTRFAIGCSTRYVPAMASANVAAKISAVYVH